MVAWRYEISLLELKKIFHSFAALTREIFKTEEKRNFVSPRGHVISSIYVAPLHLGIFNDTDF